MGKTRQGWKLQNIKKKSEKVSNVLLCVFLFFPFFFFLKQKQDDEKKERKDRIFPCNLRLNERQITIRKREKLNQQFSFVCCYFPPSICLSQSGVRFIFNMLQYAGKFSICVAYLSIFKHNFPVLSFIFRLRFFCLLYLNKF